MADQPIPHKARRKRAVNLGEAKNVHTFTPRACGNCRYLEFDGGETRLCLRPNGPQFWAESDGEIWRTVCDRYVYNSDPTRPPDPTEVRAAVLRWKETGIALYPGRLDFSDLRKKLIAEDRMPDWMVLTDEEHERRGTATPYVREGEENDEEDDGQDN